MQDKPDMADLMQAVQDFVGEEIAPRLAGHAAFSARVAGNVLALMQRELDLGPRFRAAEQARLEALLNETGTLEVLNRILCDKIAKGAFGPEDEVLMDHLKRVTMGKLAIDQPTYAGYQTAQTNGWPEEG
ncbi:MAG: DUF6285 domain-containing protein [Pseudomonadota bacterium]|nr:DUF6285 domain-containing protein [Pseudomonadota bacterium]